MVNRVAGISVIKEFKSSLKVGYYSEKRKDDLGLKVAVCQNAQGGFGL